MTRWLSSGSSPVVSVSSTIWRMLGRSLPQPLPRQSVDGSVCEAVDALVAGDPGVAAHPVPVDVMPGDEPVELLPQVPVLHRLARGGEPAARLPLRHPLEHAPTHVLGIGIEI